MWARELRNAEGQRAGPKESLRWIEGYSKRLPSTVLSSVA
jgi:hypothetical protein